MGVAFIACLWAVALGCTSTVVCLEARTKHEVSTLPSSIDAFPRKARSDSTYLTKSIIKDRVPGGFATFVAHLYKAADPVHHFSVLQPKRGCGTLDTPGVTADAYGGCDVATNAGYFIPGDDIVDHACIGPIVSDGYWRHKQHRRNVMFGVMAPHEGDTRVKYFFGYLDENEMEDVRWLQLLSGVVWLVRDGKVNVADSMKYENFTAERSGSGDHFRTLRAPRLAVGIDGGGELMILAVDGSEPDWEGLSLDDVASIMVGLGAIQAINLDGGGSVSVFEGQDVVNIPSDVCPNTTFPKYRCARRVSSVLCLHRYAAPRITRTLTNQHSPTVFPSFTTFSMSVSKHMEIEESQGAWGLAGSVQRGLILIAEVVIPLVLVLCIGWHVFLKWKQRHTPVGDRTHLASGSSESDGDTSDIGGDVATDQSVELRVATSAAPCSITKKSGTEE